MVCLVKSLSSVQKPVAAVVLSLVSGVFIAAFSVVWCFWLVAQWDVGWMGGMMHEWEERMHMWTLSGIAYTMNMLGVIFGTIIVLAALMLYVNPKQHELWGALIIVFSATSVLSCMGGVGIGLILGVIGGILAIIYEPEQKKQA